MVIKYFCKKGTPPTEIHEDFMHALGKESASYRRQKKWATEFKGGARAFIMMDGLAAQKMPPLIKMSRSCTPWLCVLGGKTGMHS